MNYKTRQPFPHAAYVEGQRNFTYFDRSLTSGLTDEIISSPGDFLYIDQASTGVVSVELNMRQGGTLAPILLAAGGSIECDFASIKLTASAQLNKAIRIIVGNGARIKGGANVNASSMSVSVVDGGLARSLAAQSFLGDAFAAAVAGQSSNVQLWNPSATKNLYLERMSISVSVADTVVLGYHNAAYATDYLQYVNKYLGGENPVGKCRKENVVTSRYTAFGNAFFLSANSPYTVEFREPIMVPQNFGFIAVTSNYNVGLLANFEWYEQ